MFGRQQRDFQKIAMFIMTSCCMLVNLAVAMDIQDMSMNQEIKKQTDTSKESNAGYVAGNLLKISGWYERYGNGQLVLYPVENLGTNSMLGMSSMLGMNSMSGMFGMGGMSGMFGMGGMLGMGGMAGAPTRYQVTVGRFWVTPEGHLILYPVKGLSNVDRQ